MPNPSLDRLRQALVRAVDGRAIVNADDLRALMRRAVVVYRVALRLRAENESLGQVFGPAIAKRCHEQIEARGRMADMARRQLEAQRSRDRVKTRARLRAAQLPSAPSSGPAALAVPDGAEVGGNGSIASGGDTGSPPEATGTA